MEDQLKVLMVEDSEDDTLLLCRELKRGGYTISYERVETAQAFATALDGREWDLIIADYNMPQFSGLAALQLLQARGKDIPFLVISGFIDETIAVAAMKSGAQDYLMKDNLKRLAPVVERELRDAVVRRKRRQAEEALRASEARLRQANDALLYLARSASVQEGNLAAAFGEITEIAGLSLGVSRASIWLFNPEHTRLICHELFELDDNRHSRGQVIEVDCCPRYLTALNEHRFISTHDSHLDPRTKEFYESYTAPAGIFSSVEATIRLHSQVVGTFVLEQRHAQRHWRPDEESFVSSVADLVSLALGANQRQQAEEALRQSEQRYRDLFENANDMIYTLDLEGCFTSINRRGEELTGYTRDELISRSGEILMSPGDRSVSREHLRRKLSGESVHTVYEFEMITKNGQRRPVEINSRLVSEEGLPVRIQGVARDVSERKQLEEELRHSQKMEAIGRLAGAVAHDFNNLLTAILGYSQLLLLRLDQNSPWRKELTEIHKAGRSAATLTSQLLAFGRKHQFQPQNVDLNQVVGSIGRMLSRLIGENIELTTTFSERLYTIKADPGRLEQVIMNLAVNSRDAMPDGGKLHIETANTQIDSLFSLRHPDMHPGRYVVLTVSDTGVGMDHDTQLRIFEPFFTTKEPGKGTGLGLATVYGIVKQSDGWIEVHSEPGAGTIFRIYFPSVDEAPATAETSQPQPSFAGHETILLVEDNNTVRELAGKVLEMHGYRVLEARNASEALAICHSFEGQIAAILTDVVMPQMSGPDLVRQVQQLRPQLKVVYMSGYSDSQLLPPGHGDKAPTVVSKPFTAEVLTRTLRLVLDASTAEHPQIPLPAGNPAGVQLF